MSYLDSFKKKRSGSANRSMSRNNDTQDSGGGSKTHNDSYSRQKALEDHTANDDRHKAIMKENKMRRERIEREAKLKEEQKKANEAKALEERKKEQKNLYNKYFKPHNNYGEKIDRSLR